MKKVYSKIESINGSVITVKAEDVSYGELAQVQTSFGASLAQVNKLDGDLVSLQVFAGGRGVSTGDEVRFLGREMQVSFSDDLLGRIFNGSDHTARHNTFGRIYRRAADFYHIILERWPLIARLARTVKDTSK